MKRAVRHATTVVPRSGRPERIRMRAVSVHVVTGPDAGAHATLAGRELRVGTDPSNHLVLTDPAVSRFHLRLAIAEDGLRLVDRHSANGSFVGGVRVRDGTVAGDVRIELGQSALELRFADEERDIELSEDTAFGEAIGRSVAMRELFAAARRAAASTSTVLLLGETGTGKDVLARAIHQHSERSGGPFVVFDCGAAVPTLVEASLFGHVRGAFTGAEVDRPGVFESARGGTVFLDEIGELPLELQPKLLRVLESGQVLRVGATVATPIDVRIVAATNRDLLAEVESERFRSDLFYRLAVIPLEVPPLRERPGDVPLLAAHFLRTHLAREGGDLAWLTPHLDDAFGALARRRWPGNVRELRNVIERAAALADPAALTSDVFSRLTELRRSIGRTLRERPPLEQARKQFDREYLRDVLAQTGGDLDAAAAVAGVHRKSLERLLRRYDLSRHDGG